MTIHTQHADFKTHVLYLHVVIKCDIICIKIRFHLGALSIFCALSFT